MKLNLYKIITVILLIHTCLHKALVYYTHYILNVIGNFNIEMKYISIIEMKYISIIEMKYISIIEMKYISIIEIKYISIIEMKT